MPTRRAIHLLFASLLLVACGCDLIAPVRRVPPPPAEVPAMNLPRELREWNWGGGSCVHASTVHCFRWQNKIDLAAKWRKTYAGGETSYGLRKKLDANRIPYAYTEQGDAELLEWASRTRRGAVIFYFPSHSINFCSYSIRDGQEFAVLLDNNRIDQYLWVPKAKFLREWRGYGGFALTPVFSPAPRLPYSPFEEE